MEMDVPIGARVLCTDGPADQSTRVRVNPTTRKVTHLVVRERRLWLTERLIPIGRISGTAGGLIHLDCTRQELAEMEPLFEAGVVWADIPELDGPHSYLLDPYVAWIQSMPKRESLPQGKLCIRRGARARATDGKVGRIDELEVVPTNGEITRLLLREGHPWRRKGVAIPASQIDRLEERTVHLKLDRKAVRALPSVQVRKKRR
jgi:hypothetical protein